MERTFDYIGELPPGAWDSRVLPDGSVVFACPDHPPRLLKDSVLTIIEPDQDALVSWAKFFAR